MLVIATVVAWLLVVGKPELTVHAPVEAETEAEDGDAGPRTSPQA